MDYPKPPSTTKNSTQSWQFNPMTWIYQDCVVEECEEGFIHSEDADGYMKLYGCPKCRRYKEQIPSLKEWDGPITIRDEVTMKRRQKERRDLTDNRAERMARAKEVVGGLAKMFEKTQEAQNV